MFLAERGVIENLFTRGDIVILKKKDRARSVSIKKRNLVFLCRGKRREMFSTDLKG